MHYKIIINQDSDSGLWSAHKEYADGSVGAVFMFASSLESLIFKLEEDGEDRINIYREED